MSRPTFVQGRRVLIDPQSTRYPDANRLKGQIGHLLAVYREGDRQWADVSVEGNVYRFRLVDLLPGNYLRCPRCAGEGAVPPRGVARFIPGRAWDTCPDCHGQGYLQLEEED